MTMKEFIRISEGERVNEGKIPAYVGQSWKSYDKSMDRYLEANKEKIDKIMDIMKVILLVLLAFILGYLLHKAVDYKQLEVKCVNECNSYICSHYADCSNNLSPNLLSGHTINLSTPMSIQR
jgi:hypothetical protein